MATKAKPVFGAAWEQLQATLLARAIWSSLTTDQMSTFMPIGWKPPRLPTQSPLPASKLEGDDLPMKLQMRSLMRKLRENGMLGGPTFMYGVQLPQGEEAQIIQHCNRATGWEYRWQIRRIANGVCGEWTGRFVTPEEGLAALQAAVVN
jgi:hypothetical protein